MNEVFMDFSRLSLCFFLIMGCIKSCDERYSTGVYICRDYRGLRRIYIDSDVSFADLPSELGLKIFKNTEYADLLSVRRCNKILNKKVTFCNDFPSAVDLTTGKFSCTRGFYFEHEKTQECFELLKDGKLNIQHLTIDSGDKEGAKAFITEWQNKKPSTMAFGGKFMDAPDALTLVAESVFFNNHLSRLVIKMKDMSKADQKAPAFILQNCPNLKDLDIEGPIAYDFLNNGQLSDDAMNELEAPLSNHKNIEIISFACNSITDKGALILAQALKRNESLRGLLLRRNKIGKQGMKALKEVGEKHKKLQCLEIGESKPDINKEANSLGYWYFEKDT